MPFRVALLLIAIGVLRIVSTYTALNHTVDEPGFISAGLEWLTRHTYTFMPEQPPLSHIPSPSERGSPAPTTIKSSRSFCTTRHLTIERSPSREPARFLFSYWLV